MLSLVPGVAHIHLGRAGRGVAYFLLFAVCLNSALMASLLVPGSQFRLGCALATGGFWLLALYDAMRIAGRGAAARRAAALAAAMAGDDEARKVTRRAEASGHV